jgi:hypothetical protein
VAYWGVVIFAIVVPRFMTVSERMGMPLLIIYLVVAALFMFSDIIGDFIGKMLKATPLAKLRMAKAKAEDEKLEADSKERREVQLKEWNDVVADRQRMISATNNVAWQTYMNRPA